MHGKKKIFIISIALASCWLRIASKQIEDVNVCPCVRLYYNIASLCAFKCRGMHSCCLVTDAREKPCYWLRILFSCLHQLCVMVKSLETEEGRVPPFGRNRRNSYFSPTSFFHPLLCMQMTASVALWRLLYYIGKHNFCCFPCRNTHRTGLHQYLQKDRHIR